MLAMYGPETAEARGELRQATEAMIARMWPEDHKGAELEPNEKWSDASAEGRLRPVAQGRRSARAQGAGDEVGGRPGPDALAFVRADRVFGIRAMLVVVILWLGILFLSIGLFAPPNATVVIALALSALSVSGAIYLILELDLPYGGHDQHLERADAPRAETPGAVTIDLVRLEADYYAPHRSSGDPTPHVSFGTSGHRGSSLERHFHRSPHPRHHPGHLRVPARARHRWPALPRQGHPRALRAGSSGPRSRSWRQTGWIRSSSGMTVSRRPRSSPTRSSHTIGRSAGTRADGIVITPSHNPPEDGGFKYNATNGGPADTDVTRWIQDRANALLRDGNAGVARVTLAAA